MLDDIAKSARKNRKPFGGLQLILVGDFMQLPPIPEEGSENQYKFCFQSPKWEAAGLMKADGGTVQLEEVMRQKNDRAFIDILNEVRRGRVSKASIAALNACLVTTKMLPTDGIVPTKLHCHNKGADQDNSSKLAALPGETYSLTATDVWKVLPQSAAAKKKLQEAVVKSAPDVIELKVNAQVMLLRNSREKSVTGKSSLVNGSQGIVVRFEGVVPVVRFDTGRTMAVRPVDYEQIDPVDGGHIIRSQIPLKLAWLVHC
jgi:ATP-dependent DNA helicase PIF1